MPQMREQKKFPEKELNEMETSNLPILELKKMLIMMLRDLSENFKGFSENFNNMGKDIETIKKKPVRN